MSAFASQLLRFLGLTEGRDKKSGYIFYKIVASTEEGKGYTLQCINTKAVFRMEVDEIVFDQDILHGLHPVQACYVGIEHAQAIKDFDHSAENKISHKKKLDKYSIYSFLAILMMELQSIPLHDIFKVAITSYLIKATYSLVFAAPANALVNFLKKITGIDVYDFPKSFTPFKYLNTNNEVKQ